MATTDVAVLWSTVAPAPIENNPAYNSYISFRVWFFAVGIGGTLVGSAGIAINILTLGILISAEARSDTKSTTSLYLISMASNDLVYLTNTLCFRCLEHLYSGITGSDLLFDNFSQRALPYYYSVESITLTWSVYTIVMMSIDRTICIIRPLEWKTICSKERVQKTITCVWFITAMLNIPMMLQFRFVMANSPDTNETFLDSESTEFSKTFFVNKVYMVYLYPLFDSVVPILIIGASNIITARSLAERHKTRKSLTREHLREKKEETYRITAMVITISIQVLITQSVKMVYFIVSGINDTRMIEKCPTYCASIAALARFFSLLMTTCNSVCIFYFGKKYRKLFLKKYGCWKFCRIYPRKYGRSHKTIQ